MAPEKHGEATSEPDTSHNSHHSFNNENLSEHHSVPSNNERNNQQNIAIEKDESKNDSTTESKKSFVEESERMAKEATDPISYNPLSPLNLEQWPALQSAKKISTVEGKKPISERKEKENAESGKSYLNIAKTSPSASKKNNVVHSIRESTSKIGGEDGIKKKNLEVKEFGDSAKEDTILLTSMAESTSKNEDGKMSWADMIEEEEKDHVQEVEKSTEKTGMYM
jgi:hypothetical protein